MGDARSTPNTQAYRQWDIALWYPKEYETFLERCNIWAASKYGNNFEQKIEESFRSKPIANSAIFLHIHWHVPIEKCNH